MSIETEPKPSMTPAEIALLVKGYREAMAWSQETLAELAGLTPRTIQRVEAAQPSSLDTRRAIARGFQIPDLDVFCKPNPFPTTEELENQKTEFDRKFLFLDATMADGRAVIAALSNPQGYGGIVSGSTSELSYAAQNAFASIIDFAHECMNVSDIASRREMLDYGDQLETIITELRATGFSLCMAVRQTCITNKSWNDSTPIEVNITYLVANPADAPPTRIVVPRDLGIISF